MCGCGLASSAAITRATSSAATGEVLPSPNGSLIRSDSLTESGVKVRKKPSRNTVGRTCTTGRPDQFSACSESHCSLCCGLAVVFTGQTRETSLLIGFRVFILEELTRIGPCSQAHTIEQQSIECDGHR